MADYERYIAELSAEDLGKATSYEYAPGGDTEVRATGTLQEIHHTRQETRITIGDVGSPTTTMSIIDGLRNSEIIELTDPLDPHFGRGV